MPAKIRLARHGRKSRPYYYIVVADSRAPRDGKFIERIGSYNPVTNPATIELDFDKALSWIQKGAQPTDTARAILKYKGVLLKNHLIKGAAKGALTEEQVEQKFQAWLQEKDAQIQGKVKRLEEEKNADFKGRFQAESKVREAMAAELAKKNAIAAKADVDEEAAEEVVEEVAEVEVAAETVEVVEAPAAEEAPVVEEPQAEATEEPAGEEEKSAE